MDVNSMSLDDIIKKRKIGRRTVTNVKPTSGRAGGRTTGPAIRRVASRPVRDARDIICTKTRSKITDARDRLNQKLRQGDARERLRKRGHETKRLSTSNGGGTGGGSGGRRLSATPPVNRGAQPWPGRQLTSYMDVDDGIDLTESAAPDRRYMVPSPPYRMNPQAIKRTVHNEVFSLPTTMPPLPRFRTVRTVTETPLSTHCPASPVDLPWSDPFKTYERLRRPHLLGASGPVSDKIMPYEKSILPAPPPRGILRKPTSSQQPLSEGVGALHLSSSMRARLERAPNPSESMGIFSKLPSDSHSYTSQSYKPTSPKTSSSSSGLVFRSQPAAPPSPPTSGYRIVVSNLHSKVIHQDIQELFGDIGDLLEARLVRPGVAEVIYRTLKDAEKAVDAYHNRQLDGQPMNCLLVHPRASNKPTAPALSAMKYGMR